MVYNGRFLVAQNFETQGDLLFIDDIGAGEPKVVVRQGKIAKFNVAP